jgi:phosphopantetheine adenylyltransferase
MHQGMVSKKTLVVGRRCKDLYQYVELQRSDQKEITSIHNQYKYI